jgi:hypothetical protein
MLYATLPFWAGDFISQEAVIHKDRLCGAPLRDREFPEYVGNCSWRMVKIAHDEGSRTIGGPET